MIYFLLAAFSSSRERHDPAGLGESPAGGRHIGPAQALPGQRQEVALPADLQTRPSQPAFIQAPGKSQAGPCH